MLRHLYSTGKVILFSTLTVVLWGSASHALSWTEGDVRVQGYAAEVKPQGPAVLPGCSYEPIEVGGEANPYVGCVVKAKNFSLAALTMEMGYRENVILVKIGTDRYYYILQNRVPGSYVKLHVSRETDTVVQEDYTYPDRKFTTEVYKDFVSHLEKQLVVKSSGVRTEYLPDEMPDYMVSDQSGQPVDSLGGGLSTNGKFYVFQRGSQNMAVGLARLNLETYEVKLFAATSVGASAGAVGELMTISDSGETVLVGINHREARLYTLTPSCGVLGVDWPAGLANCESVFLREKVRTTYGGTDEEMRHVRLTHPRFIDDYRAELYAENNTETAMRLTVTADGYTEPSLDYLALGDSYSSGEGDTTKNPASGKKYYRIGTDNEENQSGGIPREKCHVSTRSYPYILSVGMALGQPLNSSSTKWQTVACSGAHIGDASSEGSLTYKGQGKGGSEKGRPRLDGYGDWQSLKAVALNEFIPGRQKQIEFVKKYKPKVITLTMGGNDAGFGDKVATCLFLGTCNIATPDGRKKHAQEILDQYGDLKKLYEDLHDKSGSTSKIYVLGYPRFINSDDGAPCGVNVQLDNEEKEMVDNSIILMNNVIEQAAKAAGVKYIDVSNSLDGGRLCDEGQEYMTGIAAWMSSENQESFHPNAKGHFQIAMTVWDKVNSESLLDYDICPGTDSNRCPDDAVTPDDIEVPTYFGSIAGVNSQYTNLTAGNPKKNNAMPVTVDPYTLRPSSTASITIYSDPTHLGDFTVAADGSLAKDIQLPNTLPAGYHTLVITGETYSGETIELEQVVLVEGTDPDDLDENGTPDSQQPCGPFLPSSGQDTDLDGIDDACDPEISSAPQLYRVRTGDPERVYGLQPEHEDYLYVERNTRASSITGITGDYDPDGDGWAIVGASQGTPYTTSSVPDTAPAANFLVVGDGVDAKPYIYIRAGGYGCTSFTPVSLAQVQDGQFRTIKKVDYNTDKCRQEAPDYDVDGNGQTDDTQPLYTARNGDSDKGEDPARIYLYRNFHATEAQLGISDYTPTGTPAGLPDQPIQDWNLLASSKPGVYIPAFNKLVTLEPNTPDNPTTTPLPIILTKKQNGQCIAYRPETTDIIKKTTQNNRYLVKLAGLPGGVGCE